MRSIRRFGTCSRKRKLSEKEAELLKKQEQIREKKAACTSPNGKYAQALCRRLAGSAGRCRTRTPGRKQAREQLEQYEELHKNRTRVRGFQAS
ncbi:hypothetical protein PO124_10555 [Bacillus licheniformis]|nr:hypothetical protein [Bacillus licheniformis]